MTYVLQESIRNCAWKYIMTAERIAQAGKHNSSEHAKLHLIAMNQELLFNWTFYQSRAFVRYTITYNITWIY